jgi:hypothetical protein
LAYNKVIKIRLYADDQIITAKSDESQIARHQLNKIACEYDKHFEIKNYSNGHAWEKYLKGKNTCIICYVPFLLSFPLLI